MPLAGTHWVALGSTSPTPMPEGKPLTGRPVGPPGKGPSRPKAPGPPSRTHCRAPPRASGGASPIPAPSRGCPWAGEGCCTPYHASLPDDVHAVLHPADAVGDLGEVLLAHGFLLGAEGPVVRGHDVQRVAAGGRGSAADGTAGAARPQPASGRTGGRERGARGAQHPRNGAPTPWGIQGMGHPCRGVPGELSTQGAGWLGSCVPREWGTHAVRCPGSSAPREQGAWGTHTVGCPGNGASMPWGAWGSQHQGSRVPGE